jgi:hypothetical protein
MKRNSLIDFDLNAMDEEYKHLKKALDDKDVGDESEMVIIG